MTRALRELGRSSARKLAERSLGRPLRPDEIVRARDGRPWDGDRSRLRPGNLCVVTVGRSTCAPLPTPPFRCVLCGRGPGAERGEAKHHAHGRCSTCNSRVVRRALRAERSQNRPGPIERSGEHRESPAQMASTIQRAIRAAARGRRIT